MYDKHSVPLIYPHIGAEQQNWRKTMKDIDLQKIRGQLDEIDSSLVSLFEKRMELCRDVAEFKIGTGKPVYDGEREQQKIAAVKTLAGNDFNRQGVQELFSQIMTISRRLQYGLLAERGQEVPLGFQRVKELPCEGARVCYQGVEGAYAHAAAIQYFGETADFRHVCQWEDAMKAIRDGEADYAVLPIENSSAGMVSDNYDLLVRYDNYIVGETFLPVNHMLLGLPEAGLQDIRTVVSHPQGLMQCSAYLNGHQEWKQISVENTAVAARKILNDHDVTQAAVASEIAGKLYGLKTLESRISNQKDNTTRFIILSRHPYYREEAGKISLCFEVAHRSGSLYNLLGNIIYNNLNMFMIQSRPIPDRNWEYRFFVDIEGNLSEASVRNAIKGISEEAACVKILGNY